MSFIQAMRSEASREYVRWYLTAWAVADAEGRTKIGGDTNSPRLNSIYANMLRCEQVVDELGIALELEKAGVDIGGLYEQIELCLGNGFRQPNAVAKCLFKVKYPTQAHVDATRKMLLEMVAVGRLYRRTHDRSHKDSYGRVTEERKQERKDAYDRREAAIASRAAAENRQKRAIAALVTLGCERVQAHGFDTSMIVISVDDVKTILSLVQGHMTTTEGASSVEV